MNLRRVRRYRYADNAAHTVHVYEMGDGGPHAELHVAEQPDLPPARLGAGGVHHVAFRTPNEAEYHAWRERLDRWAYRTAAKWTGTTSGASTSASRTEFCSRSPPTGRVRGRRGSGDARRACGAAAVPGAAAGGDPGGTRAYHLAGAGAVCSDARASPRHCPTFGPSSRPPLTEHRSQDRRSDRSWDWPHIEYVDAPSAFHSVEELLASARRLVEE